MQSTPLITGLALATPLGNTLSTTWNSLCEGNAITDHAHVPHIDNSSEPRVNVLAQRVAREALADSRWSADQIRSAALIVGTSKGPVDDWLASLEAPQSPRRLPAAFGLAETASAVAHDLDITGPRLTLSAACASGLHALIRATMMIRAGEVQRVLVVASESSLHPLFIASFNRLGVIPRAGHGCRPFDTTRAGFVISEAAAAVCLEAADASSRNHDAFPAVERFAMGADATHLTGADLEAAALRSVFHRVMESEPIDLIHAHGTGTLANDPIELAAIEASLLRNGEILPNLYSHKAALGHSLGAAGLVAVVINAMCHRHGIVPPNIHTRDPITTKYVALRSDLHRRPVRRSVAIAAGFGGAVAAVTLISQGK